MTENKQTQQTASSTSSGNARQRYAPRKPRAQGAGRAANTELHLYPLGGLGEVGKNMTVYECNGDMIVVDCGLVFPDDELLGIDLVIPDFTFIEQNADKIKGIVITHGHEDHIGSLPYLLRKVNLPLYATKLTCGLIKNKLEEFNLVGKTKIVEISPKVKFKLGCFTIEPIHVNHSIPDAVAFAIDSPAGVVIQTGDFKIDYTPLYSDPIDLATFSAYGDKGVLALLSDSTNAERSGFTATEQTVKEGVQNLFARAGKQRIIIATFASNLARVQQIIDIAVAEGRKVAFSGRSMLKNTAMAQEIGMMRIPDGTLIEVEQINQYPPEKIVLITTGSQGETLSALSRMAANSHRQVRVGPGDFIIISATPIPGNEKSVTKIINGLLLLGAEVIYESMYDVHVSGHACKEEQKLMINLTRPKYFLPVHGEYKQLKKHALTAASLGVPYSNIIIAENGSNIIMSNKELKLGEPVSAGAVMVDGLGVGDVGNVVLRDRKHLSEDGIMIVVATVDRENGVIVAGPDLVSRGFVYVRENEDMMNGARALMQNTLERCMDENVRDWNSVKTRVREALSSYIYRKTKRSPMVLPVLMEV
ncbi:MAG: ribonuclease J [Faecalibacterium sp.]